MSDDNKVIGSKWYKVDFHVHTPVSSDYQDVNITPEQWLLAAMNKGLDAVVVTDHNSGAWVDKLKAAYEKLKSHSLDIKDFRELIIFPGVEITADHGIHVLGVFDPSCDSRVIVSLLAQCGIIDRFGRADTFSRKSFSDVISIIEKAKGIPIPAHIDYKEGFLGEDQLKAGLQPFQKEVLKSVYAAEFHNVDAFNDKSDDFLNAIKGISKVRGSDAHALDAIGSKFSWIKMSDRSIDSLKIALKNGSYCVNNGSSAPNVYPLHYIKSLNISGMKYCARKSESLFQIDFHPQFNAIIGGRGSGKSTAIESIRVVTAAIDNLKNESPRLYNSLLNFIGDKNDGVMLPDSKISLAYVSNKVEYQLSWDFLSQKVSLRRKDKDGYEALESDDAVIHNLCPVSICSQNQINELATNTQGVLFIVDQSPAVDKKDWDSRWSAAQNKFCQLCADKRFLERDLSDYLTVKNELEHVKNIISRFENNGVADIIRKYNQFDIQEKSLLHSDFFQGLSSRLHEAVNAGSDFPDFPDALFANSDARDEITEIYKQFKEKFDGAKRSIQSIANSVKHYDDEFQKLVKSSKWYQDLRLNLEDYHNLIHSQSNDSQRSDLSQFEEAVKRRSLLSQRLKELDRKKIQIANLDSEIKKTSEQLIDLRTELFNKRKQVIDKTIRDNKYVRMELVQFGDLTSAESEYRRILNIENYSFKSQILDTDDGQNGGILAELVSCDKKDKEAVLKAVQELKQKTLAIASGSSDLGKSFAKKLKGILEDHPESVDKLLSWLPDDFLVVKYRENAREDNYRDISKGSSGQKASAILAFLLSYGDCPLILDQPEDDLDNALIYDLAVRQILENKPRRQMIFVTHNPNIVVNGDAELVTVLGLSKGQIEVERSGGLADIEIRNAICSIMEGGAEAFRQRYRVIMHDREL